MSKYWKSVEEKGEKQKSVPTTAKKHSGLLGLFNGNEESLKATRRDFLKLFGYSAGVTAIASSCEQPIRKAIPYLIKPENITPGMASYFASSFFEENHYSSILVKVRDGRPIKIEGNKLSDISKGGTTARVQASVLSVYDTNRFQSPMIEGEETDWANIDEEVIKELESLKASNKKLVILTSTIISPSTKEAIKIFKQKYPNTEIVSYDAVSASGMLEANKESFGNAVLPNYRFDKAKVIVSFGADFLGTWFDPTANSKGYSKMRDLTDGQKSISKHIQYESIMSLTGSNADERFVIKPSEERLILANLYNEIAKNTGDQTISVAKCHQDISEAAKSLLSAKGKSIVVSGSNDKNIQLIVNAINNILGNINKTVDFNTPLYIKQGIDSDIAKLKSEIKKGSIGGIIFYNTNPVYNISGFGDLLDKVNLKISLNSKPGETTEKTKYICPDHNFLESWNDYEPIAGQYSLAQPVIAPLFKTRQAQETLLTWAGNNTKYYDFVKSYWKTTMFAKNTTSLTAANFWNKSLQDGCVTLSTSVKTNAFDQQNALKAIKGSKESNAKGIELTIYEKVAIGSGELANIPWLQEMPDPVSKATWDNYLTVSPKYAEENSLKTGDEVKIGENITLPVYIQPGQAYGTAGIALGYGRKNTGLVANNVGVDAYQLVSEVSGNRIYSIDNVTIEPTGNKIKMAITQTHHSMEGRELVRNASLEEYVEDEAAGNHTHEKVKEHLLTLYNEQEYNGHHWGMAIDLTKCTGCSACVVSCQVENNIPVVGKNEVSRVHEMHWIRIDRYYYGSIDNPETLRQPVMCQHCDNAPCENVCPVGATNHSSEGLNQMAYNRCIGTRYCNNNCPYKVRRFNFFDYTGADSMKGNEMDVAGMTLDLPRMVLNPDVTVRAKGVIEKCSFCVQRIQEKKLTAKKENRELADGDITPACAQACSADAIVFGDLNNKESKVAKYFSTKRNYHLLEELHTLPSVGYLTKIKNRKPEEGKKELIKHDDHDSHGA